MAVDVILASLSLVTGDRCSYEKTIETLETLLPNEDDTMEIKLVVTKRDLERFIKGERWDLKSWWMTVVPEET